MSAGNGGDALAFVLLVHEHPLQCARLARHLLTADHRVVVHLDRKAPGGFRDRFSRALGDLATAVTWARPLAVDWGGWTLVRATLNALETLQDDGGPSPGHVQLLSGADYPLRPLGELADFLARHPDTDFIEHHSAEGARWVRDGPQRGRYAYHHWFNWRRHPRLFELSLSFQRRLGLQRTLPANLEPHLGSQWWTLSWSTCERALALGARPEVARFFRHTWVPDELFFQSVAATGTPAERLDGRCLTHHLFSPRGTPVTFHDDHADYLCRQPFFFARKLSPRADDLRDSLDRRISQEPLTALADDVVGRATDEHPRFIERHRLGLRGQRSWGRPGNRCLGEMERNSAPYYVVVAGDDALLGLAASWLDEVPGLRCHGRLFAAGAIEWARGMESLAGYRRDDVALRDQDQLNFLAETLRAATERTTGFTWRIGPVESAAAPAVGKPDRAPDLLAILARDPRCHVLHLGDPDQDASLRGRLERYSGCGPDTALAAQWHRLDPARVKDRPGDIASLLGHPSDPP